MRTNARSIIGAIALALLAPAAGCVSPASVFTCDTSDQCTTGGTCQPNGFCSFADATCPSGQAYGEAAGGGLAGICVGDEPAVDAAGPDGPPGSADGAPDGMPDATQASCTTPFVESVNGCHAFLTPTTATYDEGRTMCQALGGDLSVVETVEESTYIAANAGIGGADRALMGLDFRSGTWTWIDGTGLTFTNWDTGEPSPGDNIGVIRPTPTGTWAGRGATESYILVCEK